MLKILLLLSNFEGFSTHLRPSQICSKEANKGMILIKERIASLAPLSVLAAERTELL